MIQIPLPKINTGSFHFQSTKPGKRKNKRPWPGIEQKFNTFKTLGYSPFPLQAVIHQSEATVIQIVGAEAGGKSYVTSMEIVSAVSHCDLIYLIGETYDNPRKEFGYIEESLYQLKKLDPRNVSRPRVGQWAMVTKDGCTIKTLSVQNGASNIIATGEEPDIFAICEAGIVSSYSVFTACVRRATRSDGRVILSGTLKDNFGWYATLVDELAAPANLWRGLTFTLPAWSNLALYPGGEDDPEIKRLEAILPQEEFERTIAAKRTPSKALVFPEFEYAKHVRDITFDKGNPVTLWIDPGYFPSAYVVLAVQFDGPYVHIFDEVYLNFKTHTQVIDECKSREWWPNVTRAVIDFAGRQHHAEASAEEVWQHYAKVKPHSQQVGVLDGISRHRSFLHPARLFHSPLCVNTLREYKQYKRKTDRDGNVTSDQPIDADNHAMKAIAYGLVDRYGFVDNKLPDLAGMVLQGRARGW